MPWVPGCCGPRLRIRVSVVHAGQRNRSAGSGGCRRASASGVGGHLGGAEGVLLAQRVPLPVVRHQDAAQVGVAAEADAVHVEDFALVPVGGGEDGGDAGEFGMESPSARS